MAKISQQDVKTASEVFFIFDVVFTNNNHFGSSKYLHLTFFEDTQYTATLSHIQNIVM